MSTPDTAADLMANRRFSNGWGSSQLTLEVFAVRKWGRDKVIGELEEKLETLLALDDNGGDGNSHSLSSGC